MLKVIGKFLLCLATFPALSQSTSEYKVATITAVQPHQGAADSDSSAVSYDVSLKVGTAEYVVLYTSPYGLETVRYASGRELLVLVGEKTITFNDILGNSSEVPILSQTAIRTLSSPANVARGSSLTGAAPPPQAPIKSTEVIGLASVKEKTEGNLTIEDGKLCFTHSGGKADIAAAAMEDVVTGDDSQRVIGSMLRYELDSLTIQYRDDNGGLHGVAFTMPAGAAESFKQALIAQGAHTTIPEAVDTNVGSSRAVATEVKP